MANLRPDVRLTDAPIICAYRKDFNVGLRTAYLKTSDQYNSLFAVIVPTTEDVEKIVSAIVPAETVMALMAEITDLHYSIKMQYDKQKSQYKLSVTGLPLSANPAISVTSYSQRYDFLWSITMWKLAALQFPLTYVQKERESNDYGIG